MTVLLEKRLGRDTTQYGLTIQVGLSGFSFKIRDAKASLLHHSVLKFPDRPCTVSEMEAPLRKAVAGEPLLRRPYGRIRILFDTEKHTLVPAPMFSPGRILSDLSSLYDLQEYDEVYARPLPFSEAVLLYALPNAVTALRHYLNGAEYEYLPVIAGLLDRIPALSDHNRVCCACGDRFVHVAASEASCLKLAVSYPASEFSTACYYLFSAVREVLFNPGLTRLYFSGSLSDSRRELLTRYFSDVQLCEL